MSILAYMFNQINITMKRILMYMAMVLGTVAFWSCDPQEKPDPQPDPQPALQSFEVKVDAVTKTSVTYSVTPSLLDKEYIAVVKLEVLQYTFAYLATLFGMELSGIEVVLVKG